MHGPGVVKNRDLRRQLATFHQIIAFQAALIAEAHRTDIAAAITLDTLDKFIHPIGESVGEHQGIDCRYGLRFPWLDARTCGNILRVGLRAFTGIGQFLRTGETNRNNLFGIELVPCIQGLQAPVITTSDQNAEYLLRVCPGDIDKVFIERVSRVSGGLVVTERHSLQILTLLKKVRSNMAVLTNKAKKTLYLTLFQKLSYFILNRVNHKTPCL
jgi:hypothetical protein